MMKPKTPEAIANSHKNLFYELKTIIDSYPKFKEPAQFLRKVMSEHFQKEESYALSPLGLLLDLSEDKWELDENTINEMSKSVNTKLSDLKEDHRKIYDNMKDLKNIAEKDNNLDLKKFLNNLETHMELEDQVIYPATILIVNSILIGDYFKKSND